MCTGIRNTMRSLTSKRMAMSTTRCRVAPCTNFTTVLAADEEAISTSTSMYLFVLQMGSPVLSRVGKQAKLQQFALELYTMAATAAADGHVSACSILDGQQCMPTLLGTYMQVFCSDN